MGEPSRPSRPPIEWGGLPSAAMLRAGAGLLLAVLAATFGAFVLGEYQFDGALPVAAGILYGAVIAEVVVEVGRRRTLPVAVATGLIAAGGLVWAGWISAGEGLEPIPAGAKLAAGIAFVVAAARTFDWRAWREARRPPSEEGLRRGQEPAPRQHGARGASGGGVPARGEAAPREP